MKNQFYNQEKIPCRIGDIICDSVRPDNEELRTSRGLFPGIYVVAGISVGNFRLFDNNFDDFENSHTFDDRLCDDVWIHTYSLNGSSFEIFPAKDINNTLFVQCPDNLEKIATGYFYPEFVAPLDKKDRLVVTQKKFITDELNFRLVQLFNHGFPTRKLTEEVYEITYEVQYSDGTTKTRKDMITKTVYDEAVRTGLFVENLSDKK